jgi:hypothetical protein
MTMDPVMTNLSTRSDGGCDPVGNGTKNGTRTCALWSCELHTTVSFPPTTASPALSTPRVDLPMGENDVSRQRVTSNSLLSLGQSVERSSIWPDHIDARSDKDRRQYPVKLAQLLNRRFGATRRSSEALT